MTRNTRAVSIHTLCGAVLASCTSAAIGQVRFVDSTAARGLEDDGGPISAAHVCAVDLDGDGYDDLVVGRRRVFMNRERESGRTFDEVLETGLPELERGDVVVFADVDNDGTADAIVARSLDARAEGYQPPAEGQPGALCWLAGNGDGTFGRPLGAFQAIESATPGTTAAVAMGDLDLDGRLDVVVGQWYTRYGQSFEGYANDVLLQRGAGGFERVVLPVDGVEFDQADDVGGRPTYGVLIADLLGDGWPGREPQILELNYGRRWNRLWAMDEAGKWKDVAPEVKLDGDAIRHGRHPQWLKERAKTDPRFDRDDEPPFRANGNSFDAAVGDLNGDGQLDVLLTEITHGWAGESSDPSRVLVRQDGFAGPMFVEDEALSLDRTPSDPTVRSWNQGDIYGVLADLDLDGRLDVVVCSSDYPDNQRLRIWRQQEDGSLIDVTSWSGIDHIGAGQPALLDYDLDGDLDLVVGQGFNRLSAAQRAGRRPRIRLFENRAADGDRSSIVLKLQGDPSQGMNADAIGAVVRVSTTLHNERITRVAHVVGPGGHQGKQGTLALVFAVGAQGADTVEVTWPDEAGTRTVLRGLAPGVHRVTPEADD